MTKSGLNHLYLTSVFAGQKTVTLQSQCSQTIQPSQHASGHVAAYGPPWAPRRGISILHKGCGTNWNSWCHGEWSFWLPSEQAIPSITHRLTACQNGVLGVELWVLPSYAIGHIMAKGCVNHNSLYMPTDLHRKITWIWVMLMCMHLYGTLKCQSPFKGFSKQLKRPEQSQFNSSG